MISKITWDAPRIHSYELMSFYAKDNLESCQKDIADYGKFCEQAAALISFLLQYPNYNIKKAIVTHISGWNAERVNKTKKIIVYKVGWLFIYNDLRKLPTITGFNTVAPNEMDEDDFWTHSNPEEVQFYLIPKKANFSIAFLNSGEYYTEAMKESECGSLQACVKFLEETMGEKIS